MWSEAELLYKANQMFADNVREMSNGRIQIETFSSGALMSYTEYFDALRGGVVEMMQSGGGYYSGKDPAFQAFESASIIIGDYPRTLMWLYGGGGNQFARDQYAKWDLRFIAPSFYTFAGESIVSKIPIKSFDDVKGLKIRAPETLAPVWASLGADVLTIPGAEVYTALSTGLIEASDWGSPAMNLRVGYAEIAPYYSRPGDYYMGATAVMVIGMEAWNSLPDDLKVIVQVAADWQNLDAWTLSGYDDLTATEALTAAGAEMIVWDADLTTEMKRLISEVQKELASESEDGLRIVQAIEAFLEAVEK